MKILFLKYEKTNLLLSVPSCVPETEEQNFINKAMNYYYGNYNDTKDYFDFEDFNESKSLKRAIENDENIFEVVNPLFLSLEDLKEYAEKIDKFIDANDEVYPEKRFVAKRKKLEDLKTQLKSNNITIVKSEDDDYGVKVGTNKKGVILNLSQLKGFKDIKSLDALNVADLFIPFYSNNATVESYELIFQEKNLEEKLNSFNPEEYLNYALFKEDYSHFGITFIYKYKDIIRALDYIKQFIS